MNDSTLVYDSKGTGMMKGTLVAFLIILTTGLFALAHGKDLTFLGDVGITGSGNGLTFPDGTKQVPATPRQISF